MVTSVPNYYETPAHEECIFALVPPNEAPEPKPPMFRSKIAPKPDGSFGKTKGQHSNFGKKAGSYRNSPANFVKVNSGAFKVESLADVKKNSPEKVTVAQRKPHVKDLVPAVSEKPIMGLTTNKNFVVSNAVEVILANPKKIKEPETPFNLTENYGKTPEYITKVKNAINEEYEAIRNLMQAQEEAASPYREMNDDERAAIIQALKAKWESVNHEFQAQAHLTTLSPGEKMKKEGLENALADIEKKINKFSAPGPIQVAVDY